MLGRLTFAAIAVAASSHLVFAADDSAGSACSGKQNVVVAARTPEVDLFNSPTGGQPVSTLTKDKFPPCLKILEQSPARMLKVEINGSQYWIEPHTVRLQPETIPVTCRQLTASDNTSKTGTTRGLGEGC
jgi:hypothetical protein